MCVCVCVCVRASCRADVLLVLSDSLQFWSHSDAGGLQRALPVLHLNTDRKHDVIIRRQHTSVFIGESEQPPHRADVLLVASDSLHLRRVHDRGATTHFLSVLDLSRGTSS